MQIDSAWPKVPALCPGKQGGTGDALMAERQVSVLQLIRAGPCPCPAGKSPEALTVASL